MLGSLLVLLAVLTAAGATLGFLLGLPKELHAAMDSFAHFRLHFLVVLGLSCLIILVLSHGTVRFTALVVMVVCAGWLTVETRKGPPQDGPRADLRVVQFNLNYRNWKIDQVSAELIRYDADVITLQEVTPAHEATLRLISTYPHQTHCFFRDRIGGVSILSKHALSSVDCANGQGLVAAVVDAPGGAVTVASIHTYWPWPFSQHAQVDAWLPRLSQKTGPMIVAGDFNAAPWSHAVAKVAKASRTAVVPGLRLTIDVGVFPIVPDVPIPIDHVLLSDELCASSAYVGPEMGSDHYPVIVEVKRSATGNCGQG